MSGTPDTYAAWLENMQAILNKNFSATVPADTDRLKGLDPQTGFVVGLQPASLFRRHLGNALTALPEHYWSTYGAEALHLTLGAVENRGATRLNEDQMDQFGALARFLLAAKLDKMKGPWLSNLHFLFSQDTMVLVGTPNEAVYNLRQALTNPEAEAISAAGIRPGWGAHLTVARARRPLTAYDLAATSRWVEQRANQDWLQGDCWLPMAMVGAFVVREDRFRFAARAVRALND